MSDTSFTFPRDSLFMWVIYNKPLDAPDDYVVRCWVLSDGKLAPSTACALCKTLKEARMMIPPGLHCLGRSPEDDFKVVETWL